MSINEQEKLNKKIDNEDIILIPVLIGGVVSMYLSIVSGLTITETMISGLITIIVGGLIVKYWGVIWSKIQMLYWKAVDHPKSWEGKTPIEKIKSGLQKRNRG